MTGRSKENWRGGRRSQHTTQREAATEKSWKRSKRPAAAQSTHRPWTKIVFTILSMLILVALGIWIFQPVNKVRTHFVILDLLSNPSDATGRCEFFDPVKAPNPPKLPESRRPLGVVTSSHSPTLEFINPNDADLNKENLNKANVVVVYLQTQLVAASDGTVQCLNKASTPDLTSKQSEALTDLKPEIAKLIETGKRVLLIVDEIESLTAWRLGDFHAEAATVSSWPDDEKFENRLVVIASHSRPPIGVSGGSSTAGKTMFGSVVADGLSQLADIGNSNDNQKQLDVAEFCEYVVRETNVRNRDADPLRQRAVFVNPPPEQLQEAGQNFVLLGELPAAPKRGTVATGTDAFSKLNERWQKRDELNKNLAWRWRPMLWQQSTELLLRTQQAALNEQYALAEKLLGRADAALQQLAQATQQIVSADEQLDREYGIPNLWLNDLPNSVLDNANTSPQDTVTTFALQQNIDAYPFADLGLQQASIPLEQMVACRRAAETATQHSMSVAGVIPQTIRSAERKTLATEDRLFTSGQSRNLPDSIEDNHQLWQAIDEFNRAHQRAEFMVQQTVSVSESLAGWAATFRFEMDAEFENEWVKLLRQNLPSHIITADDLQQRLNAAERLASQSSQVFVPLRSRVFRLLVCARALQQQLHPTEPESGFVTEELRKKSQTLADMADHCYAEWADVAGGFQDLISNNDLLQAYSADSHAMLQAERIQATINVTSLTADARERLIRRLQSLKQEICARQPDTQAALASETATAESSPPNYAQAALWYVQHLNLFALDGGQNVQAATDRLSAAAEPGQTSGQANALAEFGDAVRSFWQKARTTADNAPTSTGAKVPGLLRVGDRLSRGFSAFDASKCTASATEGLQKLWRVDYCLSHAERLIIGQWVLTQDRPPLAQNGWYATTAALWLGEADSLAKQFSSLSTIAPTFVSNQLNALKKSSTAAGTWSVDIQPATTNIVDLRRDNFPDVEMAFNLRYKSSPAVGTAALQLLSDNNGSLVTLPGNSKAVPLDLDQKTVDVSFHRNGTPLAGDCSPTAFRPGLFFRGRRFTSTAQILADPCASAQFAIKRTARPATASVTVFGDDVRPLAFVLDMSRSMNEKLQGGQRRFNVALDRLKSAVERQDERRRASLRVFGHRRRFPSLGETPFNEKYKAYFDEEDPRVSPNQDTTIEVRQVALRENGKDEFYEAIENLRKTEPFGTTPLLRSIREAIENDLNKKPGIVIAITDGIATDAGIVAGDPNGPNFGEDSEDTDALDESEDLKKAISQNPATKVIVVAFDLQDPRERKVMTDIMAKSGILSEQIVYARDGRELDNRIRDALDPINYRVSSTSSDDSADFGTRVDSLSPGLKYKVEYAEIAPADNVPAGPGDQLRLKVNWSERQLEFDRSPGNTFQKATRPNDVQTPWILRNISARLTRPAVFDATSTGQLDITLMLDHQERFHPVRQPKEIEFRFTSPKHFRASRIEESYQSDSGAPGYRFNIPQWPINQSVLVNATWKMERTTPEHVLTFAELQQKDSLAASGPFPNCRLTKTIAENSVLDIRLEPIGPVPDRLTANESENRVEDIRIEIGSRGQLKTHESFQPDEITTTLHRTEEGAVVFRFEGDFTLDTLADKEFAFTSRAARLDGAVRPPTMTIRPTDRVLSTE